MRHFLVLACLLAIAAPATGPALADTSGELSDPAEMNPFYFRVGTYVLGSSTAARVDGSGGIIGTQFNFEDDLNLDKEKRTLLAGFRWRFAARHYLEVEYFNLRRFGSKRLETEIRFRDEVFPIGIDVDSSFTTEVTRASYAYRLIRKPDWGLAVSAGIHVTRLQARLEQIAFDNVDRPFAAREIASVTAPLPVIGLNGAWRLGPKWALVARGQAFFLEVDDVKGSITHAAAFLEHQTFRHAGFGFGYDWFDIDVDATDPRWRGAADVRFQGPMLFVQASF